MTGRLDLDELVGSFTDDTLIYAFAAGRGGAGDRRHARDGAAHVRHRADMGRDLAFLGVIEPHRDVMTSCGRVHWSRVLFW